MTTTMKAVPTAATTMNTAATNTVPTTNMSAKTAAKTATSSALLSFQFPPASSTISRRCGESVNNQQQQP